VKQSQYSITISFNTEWNSFGQSVKSKFLLSSLLYRSLSSSNLISSVLGGRGALCWRTAFPPSRYNQSHRSSRSSLTSGSLYRLGSGEQYILRLVVINPVLSLVGATSDVWAFRFLSAGVLDSGIASGLAFANALMISGSISLPILSAAIRIASSLVKATNI
jgi:hypothetical protein